MMEYRVQEYRLDMGAYSKVAIRTVTHVEYNRFNMFTCQQYVILLGNDWYGKTLPQTVRTSKEMTKLVRSHEPKPWLSEKKQERGSNMNKYIVGQTYTAVWQDGTKHIFEVLEEEDGIYGIRWEDGCEEWEYEADMNRWVREAKEKEEEEKD